MRSTIDSVGRVVTPKAPRARQLGSGGRAKAGAEAGAVG